MGRALALDVGGTKAAAALVTGDGEVLDRDEVPTGADDDPFPRIAELVRRVQGDAEVCGIGTAGPMTVAGERIAPVNLPAWDDFPLRARVAEVTGLPTFLDLDTKSLALAEGRFGGAQGVDHYIAMVVSTGVGGGVVLDGRLLEGEEGNAGHIGHLNVEADGRTCGCGAVGCLEAEASGRAIAEITGRPAAEASAEIRERTGRLVGRAVASVAHLLGLRLAVVSGAVALGFGDDFFGPAQEELDRRARMTYARGARIVPSQLEEGPLLGAACVAWRAANR